MKLHHLELTGFGPFRERQVVDFEGVPIGPTWGGRFFRSASRAVERATMVSHVESPARAAS